MSTEERIREILETHWGFGAVVHDDARTIAADLSLVLGSAVKEWLNEAYDDGFETAAGGVPI